MAENINFGGNTTGMADDSAPDATGVYDRKTGRYRRFGETTLLDPSAIVTQRSHRTGFDETHPYGKDIVRDGIAPAVTKRWENPQRHMLNREDV